MGLATLIFLVIFLHIQFLPVLTRTGFKNVVKNNLINFNQFNADTKIKIFKSNTPFKFNITSIENQFWKLSQSKKYRVTASRCPFFL